MNGDPVTRSSNDETPPCIGDDGPMTSGDCARWLEAKYSRHGELEDQASAQMIRNQAVEIHRLRAIIAGNKQEPFETSGNHDWIDFDRIPAYECRNCKAVTWRHPPPEGPCVSVKASSLAIVNEQAEDKGLWFVPMYASEDYLQKALRRLHEAVEAVKANEGLPHMDSCGIKYGTGRCTCGLEETCRCVREDGSTQFNINCAIHGKAP